MTKFETTRNNSNLKAEAFILEHDTELSTITLYPDLKTGFTNYLAKLKTAILNQNVNIKVITTNKSLIKETLNATMVKYMLRASIQAHQLGKVEIEDALNLSENHILYTPDNLAATTAQNLYNLMNANAAVLTILKPADFTEMQAAIDSFTSIQVLPVKNIQHKKAVGTGLIPMLLDEVDIYKSLIGKLIHSYLPALAADWDDTVKVGKPAGTRHISIIMKFRDADTGDPVINVTTTFTKGSLTEVRKSTKRGCIQIYTLEVGAWTATSVSEIYNTVVNTNISVGDKRTARITLKLQKKVQPDDGTTPVTTGYGNGYGVMYNSVSLEPIAKGLVFLDKVAEPIETDDDGSWGNDHIPADSKTIRGSADGYANYFKNITITPDSDNEIDLPMDPIDDGPPAPDA